MAGINLGDFLGGLTTIGAQGAAGGLQGLVQGEEMARKFAAEELGNQLKQLEMAVARQKLQQGQVPQATHIGGQNVMVYDPMTGQRHFERAPVDPLTEAKTRADIEQSAAAAAMNRQRGGYYGVRAEQAQQPKAPTLDQVRARVAEKARTPEGYAALTPGERALLPNARPPADLPIHYARDAQGNITGIVPRRTESGVVFDPKPIGRYGTPQRQPAGKTPQETVTETTRLIPGREYDALDPRFKALGLALTDVVNEISRNPAIQGWMQPGALVRVQGWTAPVRREDVIRRAMQRKYGADVQVRWDGRQWNLLSARPMDRKVPVETRKTTGPLAQQPETVEQDEDEQD